MKIGFDHEKYLEEQSKYILERVNNYDKLYFMSEKFSYEYLPLIDYNNFKINVLGIVSDLLDPKCE